ncbi:hypothetical protein ASPZODRAFT_2118013 [Penicilliopsis zonata CBS 506.65]|uniref:Uncharacterized protein n=1 Tax=Penicilliopsis zonata CBS 506.65 TaxID=1073090 RepID=A0A1L9S7Q3_9EURO|nr:hypothetical protein ASPZODRAFT_2118013 [Penicilliopsis zonata CBS 506.65]OJJ43182.1 hypothetical protein ASPZODRAFT_2118013 [Penicilliopsis zonata CBS 506.65]
METIHESGPGLGLALEKHPSQSREVWSGPVHFQPASHIFRHSRRSTWREAGMTIGALSRHTGMQQNGDAMYVKGEWHSEQGWLPNDTEPVGNDFITVLEPQESTGRGVCIDFRKCKANITDGSPDGKIPEGDLARLMALKPYLEVHFAQAAGLKYCLAAINNHFEPDDSASEVLQPTEFCFTVIPGVLMMWVGLKGGRETGSRGSGQTSLIFAPNSTSLSPIPSGRTASIIFSQNTMTNLFLKPALQSNSAIDEQKGIQSSTKKGDTGLGLDFTLISSKVNFPGISYHSSLGSDSYHLDGLSIDVNSAPSHLTVDGKTRPTSNFRPFNMQWTSETERLNWWRTWDAGKGPSGHREGEFEVTLSFSGTGQWQGSSDPTRHPNQLGVALIFDNNFTVESKSNEPSFWKSLCGERSEIPPQYKDSRPPVPAFNIHLNPLDYFLTTNLLLPGQYVFQADQPVPGSAGDQYGLATPRDAILTGWESAEENIVSCLHGQEQPRSLHHRDFEKLIQSNDGQPSYTNHVANASVLDRVSNYEQAVLQDMQKILDDLKHEVARLSDEVKRQDKEIKKAQEKMERETDPQRKIAEAAEVKRLEEKKAQTERDANDAAIQKEKVAQDAKETQSHRVDHEHEKEREQEKAALKRKV